MLLISTLLSLILAILFISLGRTSCLALFFLGFMGVYPEFHNYQIQYLRDITLKSYGAIFFITCYLIFKVKFFFDFKKTISILTENRFIVMVAIFSLLSLLWSQDPDYTFIQTITFIFYIFPALFILNYFNNSEILKAFNICMFFLLISSLIVGYLNLNDQINAKVVGSDLWVGVFAHKNSLGNFSCFAVLFTLFQNSKLSRFLKFIIISISVFLMIKAQSTTAFVSVVLSITVTSFIWKIKKKVLRPSILVTVYVAMFFLTLFSTMLPNSLFEVLGKDSNLTGRDKVYSNILNNVSGYKILLGYGVGSYFLKIKNTSSSNSISVNQTIDTNQAITESGYSAAHAHNQILQFYVELGLIGVFLYFCILWSTFKNLHLMTRFHSLFPELKLFISLVIYIIISTQSEALLGLKLTFPWLPLLWIHATWNKRKHLLQKNNLYLDKT